MKNTLISLSTFALSLGLFLAPSVAQATQPLDEFIAGARGQSFDAREQEATARQRDWEAEAAKGRLLPSLTARGVMTHNQYEAGIPAGTFPGQTGPLTITPQNQFDATFQLDVPLIDLANYARYDQAKHFARAAEIGTEATGTQLDRAVAQAYFTYLGAEALLDASLRSLKIAEENLAYVTTRTQLGAATQLDQQRAVANVEQTRQDQADATLLRITAARNLETLAGVTPTPITAFPVDDLRKEAPLETWLAQKDTPSDRVQRELSLAAAASKRASARALLPTLSASAVERLSNATGFAGQASSYALSATLSWRLDYGTYSTARAQAAAADVQLVQAEKTRRTIADTVFEAYHRVDASIAKSRAARAQATAAQAAADLSMERYRAGAVTQLDVTQSQRDAFSAHAQRIKADTDLAYARVLLRIAVGKPAEQTASTWVPKEDLLKSQEELVLSTEDGEETPAPVDSSASGAASDAAPETRQPNAPAAPAPAANTP